MSISIPLQINEEAALDTSGLLRLIGTYHTANGCELVSSMNAPNYSVPTDRMVYRLAHKQLFNVQAGDIIDVSAEIQVTNDITGNSNNLVEWSHGLLFTDSSSGVAGMDNYAFSGDPEPSGGVRITKFNGYNLTENTKMHHGPSANLHNVGWRVPTGFSSSPYIAIIGYCAGTDTPPSTDYVQVNAKSGRIDIKHTRELA